MKRAAPRASKAHRELTRARQLLWAMRGALDDVPRATGHLVEAMHVLAALPSTRDVCDARTTLARAVLIDWLPRALRYCVTLADADVQRAHIVELGELVTVFGRWLIDAHAAGLVVPAKDFETFDPDGARAFVEDLAIASTEAHAERIRVLVETLVPTPPPQTA